RRRVARKTGLNVPEVVEGPLGLRGVPIVRFARLLRGHEGSADLLPGLPPVSGALDHRTPKGAVDRGVDIARMPGVRHHVVDLGPFVGDGADLPGLAARISLDDVGPLPRAHQYPDRAVFRHFS